MINDKKFLTALPVFNEVNTVDAVLNEVTWYSHDVLVVDDGSSDGTAKRLAARDDIIVVTHPQNRGYGAALTTAFAYAIENGYDYLVTIDCDGQHEPQRIRQFVTACHETGADIISGSRYLKSFDADTPPPEERRKINHEVTKSLNDKLDFELTDTFCGFKAYATKALKKLNITETGYAMPLELWVQAACHKLTVKEIAVPLIYLDETRTFGGQLDDGNTRLSHYYEVINRAMQALPSDCEKIRGARVG
jgi:dolichol-phosphate mannosyltransferase